MSEKQFLKLRDRWTKADEKAAEFRFELKYKYGDWFIYAPRKLRERMEALNASEDKASEAIFAFLDTHSPRSWRRGVPAHWVCESLTYADAMTTGRLAVTPPCAYGMMPADSIRFAQALENVA
jgi:hypothetical protein